MDYFTNHQKCTQQQIADYFTTLWDVPVKRRTVGDIIANKESYDADDDQGRVPPVNVTEVLCMRIWKVPCICGLLTLAHKTLLLRMAYYEKRLKVLEMNWVLQNSDIQTDD